jgi:MFS family permease
MEHLPSRRGPGTGVRAALRSPSFATLLAGYACSAIGDGMAAVAISWLAIELSRGRDTGLLVGAAVAAYTVPGVVAGLGLGRVITRWDPRLLVLAEAALRAVSLGLVAAGAAARLLTPAWYVALLGVSSLLGLLGVTGAVASVGELLPEAQRVAGNSLITLTSFAATIIGPGLAGLVIATAGADVAFGADALSYLVLVAAVLISRRLLRPPAAGPGQGMHRALRDLARRPSVFGITVTCAVFYGLYGPVEVALPVYVARVLHAGAGVLGGYWTLFGCGATVGALGASWIQRFGLWRVAVAVIAGWGICLIPLGVTGSVAAGFAALAAGGLVYGPFQPIKQTIIQRHSPPGQLAAMAAASGLLTVPAAPLGTALGGPLVAGIGPSATLLASGLATVALAGIAAAVLLVRRAATSRPPGARRSTLPPPPASAEPSTRPP